MAIRSAITGESDLVGRCSLFCEGVEGVVQCARRTRAYCGRAFREHEARLLCPHTLSTSTMIVWSPEAPAGCGLTISAICSCPFVSVARTTVWDLPRFGGCHL